MTKLEWQINEKVDQSVLDTLEAGVWEVVTSTTNTIEVKLKDMIIHLGESLDKHKNHCEGEFELSKQNKKVISELHEKLDTVEFLWNEVWKVSKDYDHVNARI